MHIYTMSNAWEYDQTYALSFRFQFHQQWSKCHSSEPHRQVVSRLTKNKKKHNKKLYNHISIHKPKRTSEIPSQYPSKQYRKQLEETSCAGQFFVSCITIKVHAIIFHEFTSTKKIIFWATKQERKKNSRSLPGKVINFAIVSGELRIRPTLCGLAEASLSHWNSDSIQSNWM